jgi:hypothetical protein
MERNDLARGHIGPTGWNRIHADPFEIAGRSIRASALAPRLGSHTALRSAEGRQTDEVGEVAIDIDHGVGFWRTVTCSL